MRVFGTGLLAIIVSTMLACGLQMNVANAQSETATGTWKLNVQKSKFNPGPAPQSQTITWEKAGDAMKFMAQTVAVDGKTASMDYTYKYDGKDYPVKGSPNVDSVSVKVIDANTTERTDKKSGKVTLVYRRTITGNIMTVTVKGTNASGQAVDSVAVYEKQ